LEVGRPFGSGCQHILMISANSYLKKKVERKEGEDRKNRTKE
jgi:hypothetical protein